MQDKIFCYYTWTIPLKSPGTQVRGRFRRPNRGRICCGKHERKYSAQRRGRGEGRKIGAKCQCPVVGEGPHFYVPF